MMIELQGSALMKKSLDALWMRQKTIANNLANIDTPGYKSREVRFEQYLKENGSFEDVPDPEIFINDSTSLREDGNNVDVDKEGVELYRVQIQYEYMIRKLSDEFSNIKIVLTEGRK